MFLGAEHGAEGWFEVVEKRSEGYEEESKEEEIEGGARCRGQGRGCECQGSR